MNQENYEEEFTEDKKENINFEELIAALLDNETIFSPKYLPRLSNLEEDEFELLKNIWPKIELSRRKSLLEDLEILSESNSLMIFESIFEFGILDTDPQIRQTAIRSLWESDDKSLIFLLLDLLDKDPADIVQAQAATGLGHFIYLGELGKLSSERLEIIVDNLVTAMVSNPEKRVQMRALEALGFSTDNRIEKYIENKFDSGDEEWLTSAIIAMGRSADEQWNPLVIDKLDHANPTIRLEATKSAGLLEITDAELSLINLLNDEDDEIRMAAAWSLSETGGDQAQHALEILFDNTDDEDELDLIQSAIDNLAYNEELDEFNLLDISPDEPTD